MILNRSDLHAYQEHSVDFLVRCDRSFLFLGLGLGKTSTVLTAISDMMDSFDISRVLVVAPLRVAAKTWPDEIAKWAHTKHLTYSVLVGNPKQRAKAAKENTQIHVVNVENLSWLFVDHFLFKTPYDMVVLDESSMFKNRETQRFKVARKLMKTVPRAVLMSATPAPNGYRDLWAQAYLLDGGNRLGPTLSGYTERYFKQLDRDGYKYALKKGAAECIQHALRDITLTLRAEDYLTMPDRFDRTVEVDLGDAVEAYENFEKDLVMDMGASASIEATSAAALVTKLMQFSNGQVYDTERKVHVMHDAKMDALKEIIAEAQEPVLVAYTFQSDRDRILAEIPQAVLLGKDMSLIDKWNRGEVPVLVTHPASAGHGLNLQHGGRHLVWFGPTFSLELYLQMNARLYRQGQTKPVVIHHIVAKGTIDEDIMKVLSSKNATQEGLLIALRHRIAAVR